MLPGSLDIPVGPPTPVPAPQVVAPSVAVKPVSAQFESAPVPVRPAPAAPRAGTDLAPSLSAVTVAPRATPSADPEAAPGRPRRRTASPARRRGRMHLIVAGTGVLALAIVTVILVGRDGPQPPPPAPPQAVSLTTGALHVTLPAGWRPADRASVVSALALAEPVAAAPLGGPSGQGSVTIGFARAGARNASLLSPAFRKSLTKDPAADRHAVRDLRGDLEAYRYDGLLPRGGGAAGRR